MKWRNSRGKYLDDVEFMKSMVGTPRKKFALFPKKLLGDNTVWMQEYYAVYVRHPKTAMSCGGVYEYFLETCEDAYNITFEKLNSGYYRDYIVARKEE